MVGSSDECDHGREGQYRRHQPRELAKRRGRLCGYGRPGWDDTGGLHGPRQTWLFSCVQTGLNSSCAAACAWCRRCLKIG